MINFSVFSVSFFNLSIKGYSIIILPDNLIESGCKFKSSFYFFNKTYNFLSNVILDIKVYADKLISKVPIKELCPNQAIP